MAHFTEISRVAVFVRPGRACFLVRRSGVDGDHQSSKHQPRLPRRGSKHRCDGSCSRIPKLRRHELEADIQSSASGCQLEREWLRPCTRPACVMRRITSGTRVGSSVTRLKAPASPRLLTPIRAESNRSVGLSWVSYTNADKSQGGHRKTNDACCCTEHKRLRRITGVLVGIGWRAQRCRVCEWYGALFSSMPGDHCAPSTRKTSTGTITRQDNVVLQNPKGKQLAAIVARPSMPSLVRHPPPVLLKELSW